MIEYLLVTITLLDIAFAKKKGKDEEKEEKKKVGTVIGIDLGTTYSCVGVWLNGKVEILANELGSRTTPSWVAFTDMDRLVGDAAKSQVSLNPTNTLFDMKRLIGRKFNDTEVKRDAKLWPFELVNSNNKPMVQVEVKGENKTFTPEEISGMVLGKMKSIAESYLGKTVKSAVVTCPAYFNDAQRQATKDAGTIAGLNVLRVLNEPTAAAIAYGMDRKYDGEKNILVYDLGGGTFDVSLLQIDDGVFEVLATNGDTHLGGEDFDQRVVSHLLKTWQKKTGFDVSANVRCVQKLRREVEKAKCALSRAFQFVIEIDNFFQGVDFKETLTRARFEELNADLFKNTLKPIEQVLKDTKLRKSDVSEVVLVGGSSRIPKIQQLVKDFFNGKEPAKGINPDEAVAYGAAVQAGLLSDDADQKMNEDLVIIDRTPLTFGIETLGGAMTPLVERGTIIPCKKSKVFSTVMDDQKFVEIRVFEGERSMSKDNHLLGEFKVSDIPPARRGVPQLEVTFDIDSNSILHVTAEEKSMYIKESITISNDKSRLTQEEIERMVKEAEEYAEEDKENLEKVKSKNELEQYIYWLRDQIDDEEKLGGKLEEEDKEKINDAISEANDWLEHNKTAERGEYKKQLENLKKIVEPIVKKAGGEKGPGPGPVGDSDNVDDL